jgi:hypothetical protein
MPKASGGNACTTVITEYRLSAEGQKEKFLIKVHYYSNTEITELVRELVWNYRQILIPGPADDGGNDNDDDAESVMERIEEQRRERQRRQRESKTAWWTLRTAFGHHNELQNEDFLKDQSEGAGDRIIDRISGWVKELEWEGTNGEWESTAETREECYKKTLPFSEDKMWPFTKIIQCVRITSKRKEKRGSADIFLLGSTLTLGC